jgi:16S rRNA (uracil1498-N3)-methyltransferase
MRIARLFTEQPLDPGVRVRLEAAAGHYLARVLRLRAGDRVVLFNGDGSDYAGSIVKTGRDAFQVEVESRLPAAPESRLRITLVQAISRGERMDQTLQKATELGVAAFQPVFTERVEVRLDERRLARKQQHWLGVIRAACEQCGRATVPELRTAAPLTSWLAAGPPPRRLVLAAGSDMALSCQDIRESEVELLVGPEGGLTEKELELAVAAGARPVSLGPRVLRTETAGPAAVAVLQAIGGDF